MSKKIIRLTESQFKRIIDKVISEQAAPIQNQNNEPFTVDFGTTFKSGQYEFNPEYSKIVTDNIIKIKNYILGKKLKNFKIVVTPGESRVTNQPPFQQLGSLAARRGEELKNYLNQVLPNVLGMSPQIEVAPPKIGNEPYKPGDNKDDPKYTKEQFVTASIVLTTQPTPTPTPQLTPNPNKGFVINVRGDEAGGVGAFYFPKTLADWLKIKNDPRIAGFFSSAEQRGDNYAQTTVNMNDDVFKKYWLSKAPDIAPLLGPPYLRDPKNYKNFILKK